MRPGELLAVLGKLVKVARSSVDPIHDECSECGRALPVFTVWAADCGVYCSRRCGLEHAEFLAREMAKRQADDARS